MNMRLKLVLVLVATLASFALTDAATYPVGRNGIWNFQASRDEYNNWASTINFTVGDILVFNFLTRTHDVATVTKAKYENCDGESPLALATEGPASITLTKSGFNYFICTLQAGGHCNSGLRLAVNVSVVNNTTAPPPPPSTTPPPITPIPSPPPTQPPTTPIPSPPPTTPTPSLPPTTPAPSPSWKRTASPSPSPSFVSSARMVVVGGAFSFLVGMIGIVVIGMVMV